MQIINPKNIENNDAVLITLDRPRPVVLSHRALKRYCALAGVSLQQLREAMKDYVEQTRLLWCALSVDDPELTPEALDELLDEHHVRPSTVIRAVSTALIAALDDGEEEEAGDPPAAAGAGATA